jgi:tripeptide aminopeptidase
MTTNVGMINGGTATNVVPERCTIEGEVREYDKRIIEAHLAMLRDTFRGVAAEFGGTVEFTAQEDFAPFRLDAASDAVHMIDDVLRSIGLTPHPIAYLGGSDANMLNGKGVPAVNLGIGAQNPHGDDEFILIEDLQKTLELAQAIIHRTADLT